MKRIMAALLVLALAFAMFPVTASAVVNEGFCGDPTSLSGEQGVTWRFDSTTNQLTLSGSGTMADYNAQGSDVPWYAYRESIHTVIFEADITSIGDNAFNTMDFSYAFLNIAFRGPAPVRIGENAFARYAEREGGVVHIREEHAAGYVNILEELGLNDSWLVASGTLPIPLDIQGLRLPAAGASPDETRVVHAGTWYDFYITEWREVGTGSSVSYFEEGKQYYIDAALTVDNVSFPEYANAFYEYCYNTPDLSVFRIPGLGSATGFTSRGEHWADGGIEINLQFGKEGSYIIPSRFVEVTDIIDGPNRAEVGKRLALTGTVVPDEAGRQIYYWEFVDSGEDGAQIDLDGPNNYVFTAQEPGTYTVRAIVERGHSIEPDPGLTDDQATRNVDESRDFWKEFTITVRAEGAPTIDGPASLTVTEGYGSVSTDTFVLTGSPTVAKQSGDDRITWNSETNKLDIAPGLPAGDYPVTLEASNEVDVDEFTFTLTVTPIVPGTSTVIGEIEYKHNDTIIDEDPENPITVHIHLERNGEIASDEVERKLYIGMDYSQYAFADVSDGWYTVVAESFIDTAPFYTVTRQLRVLNGEMAVPPERIVFTPGKTQSLVEIGPNTRVNNVSTNDLPNLFGRKDYTADQKAYTEGDEELIAAGGEVEFKLDVKEPATDEINTLHNAIRRAGLSPVAEVDLSLIKTRRPLADAETFVELSDIYPAFLDIAVPMPVGVREKVITGVYRIHDGPPPEALGYGADNANANGEYFTRDGYTVFLYVNQFSAYAFAEALPTGGGGEGNGNGGGGGGNGGGGHSDVPATGLYLNKDELPLDVGESETLIATVLPSDATDKGVTWTSSDPSVATVDPNGKVTAIKPGIAIITARSNSGRYTDSCVVTVTSAAVPPTETHNPSTTDAEDSPDVPQTGDYGNTGMWMTVLGVSALGIAGIALLYRRRQKDA